MVIEKNDRGRFGRRTRSDAWRVAEADTQKLTSSQLMERIEMEEKHWKHKDGDWDTREKFDQYLKVYQKILTRCNDVPWHVVPADKNWQKLYTVAEVVLKTLKELDLEWPALVTERFGK